jgi:CBS domain containing-hemolysin-like protein
VVVLTLTHRISGIDATVASLCLTGAVAALTIGGKALGKTFARNYSNTIVYMVALFLNFFTQWFDKKEK